MYRFISKQFFRSLLFTNSGEYLIGGLVLRLVVGFSLVEPHTGIAHPTPAWLIWFVVVQLKMLQRRVVIFSAKCALGTFMPLHLIVAR